MAPAVAGDLVYVGSCAGVFYAFDALTGELRWSFDVSADGAGQFHSNPLFLDSVVYFGTDEGRSSRQGSLYAINRYSGELLWRVKVEHGVPSDPAALDSLIYVVTYTGRLLAVNRATGDTAWEFDSARPEGEPVLSLPNDPRPKRGRSNPLVVDSLVIFHGSLQKVYALDRCTGRPVWSHALDDEVTTQLALVGDCVVYGAESKRLVYISTADGATVREHAQSAAPSHGMEFHDGRLIFLAGRDENATRQVTAVDSAGGTVHWMATLPDTSDPKAAWHSPRVHIWRDRVIVGSNNGLLAAYNVSDGTLDFSCHVEGRIRGIGSSGDVLYVGTFGGMLYAMRVEW